MLDIVHCNEIVMNNQQVQARLGFKMLVVSNYAKKQQNTLKIVMKNNGFVRMEAMGVEELFEVVDFDEPKTKQLIV